MQRIRRSSQVLLVLLALGAPAGAQAQTGAESSATAEALFRDARALMEAGNVAAACDKFAASQRIDPALGTLINLADCHEQLGRTASAWAEFLQVSTQARRAGQRDRDKAASQRAAALEPRLTRLLIDVPEAVRVQGLEVRRDGILLDPAVWNTAVPVDPGSHVISATAPGKAEWTQKLDVLGEGKTSQLAIPMLTESTAGPPVAPLPAPTSPTAGQPPAGSPPTASGPGGSAGMQHDAQADLGTVGGPQRILGLVIGGLGVAGLATGGYLGLTARSKWNDANCPNNVCPTLDQQNSAEDAKTYGNGATLAFAGGTALVATGVILFLTAPDAPQPQRTARSVPSSPRGSLQVVPTADARAAGLLVNGSF